MSSLMLDAAHVQAFAQKQHGRWVSQNRSPRWADPAEVGKVAAHLARRHYSGQFGEEASNAEVAARCAGLMVYAVQCYALDYQGVIDESEHTIARILSQITPHIAMPYGPCVNDVRSRTALAEATAQIVRLAEIHAACKGILRATPDLVHRFGIPIKLWIDETEKLLPALTKLQPCARMRPPLDQVKDLLARVAQHVERSRKEAGNARSRPRLPTSNATTTATTVDVETPSEVATAAV